MKNVLKNGHTIHIEHLSSRPDVIETAARWIYEAFIRGTPRTVSYGQVVSKLGSTLPDRLPMTFIATAGGKPAGTVSLFANDLKTHDALTPWLAALYVEPPMRGLGIAQKLIERVCDASLQLGYGILYLRTEHASAYYQKHGWTHHCRTQDESGIETDVFKILL